MNRRIRILAAATTTASLVAVAGPAVAVGIGSAEDVRYQRSTTTLAATNGTERVWIHNYATCASGWRAFAGGQTVAAKAHIADSSPSGLEYWFTAAWHESTVATTVTSYATCLDTEQSSMAFEPLKDIPASSQVTGKASCQQGHSAVGGGMSVTDPEAFSQASSYPIDDATDTDAVPDDGWRVYSQYSGNGGDDATFNVMCTGGPRPAYRTTTTKLPASGSAKAQALCPKGRPTIGGGVVVTGASSKSHMVDSRPWDSGDAGKVPEDGWRGGVVNDSAGALTMTVHAICR